MGVEWGNGGGVGAGALGGGWEGVGVGAVLAPNAVPGGREHVPNTPNTPRTPHAPNMFQDPGILFQDPGTLEPVLGEGKYFWVSDS